MSDLSRLLKKVECEPSGCWRWTGWLDRDGYGFLKVGGHNGRMERAHRASYRLQVGPIPDGLQIDHKCCNTSCVNPDHLEPVTQAENMRRRSERQTHCSAGHAFDEANTYLRTKGSQRQCRACNREAARRYTQRKRVSA